MQIFSYKGCQKCLVKSCCQKICQEYKDHILNKSGINISAKDISLQSAEAFVAMNLFIEGDTKTNSSASENIVELLMIAAEKHT